MTMSALSPRPAPPSPLTFADDRSSLSLRPLGRQDGRVALVLSPLLDPCEHGGIPEHVRHDAEHDLVPADVELLQRARLAPNIGLHAVLLRRRKQKKQIISQKKTKKEERNYMRNRKSARGKR